MGSANQLFIDQEGEKIIKNDILAKCDGCFAVGTWTGRERDF